MGLAERSTDVAELAARDSDLLRRNPEPIRQLVVATDVAREVARADQDETRPPLGQLVGERSLEPAWQWSIRARLARIRR